MNDGRKPHADATTAGGAAPVAALLVSVAGTAALRYSLELLTIPGATRSVLYLLHEVAWYLAVAASAIAILRLVSCIDIVAAERVVALALPLGILPPLVDALVYGSGQFVYRYLYQSDPWFRMTEDGGYVGELAAIWIAIAGGGLWAMVRRHSWVAGVVTSIALYLMFQFVGGIAPRWLRELFLVVQPLHIDQASLQLWYILCWVTYATTLHLVLGGSALLRSFRPALLLWLAMIQVVTTLGNGNTEQVALLAVVTAPPLLASASGGAASYRMVVSFAAAIVVAALVVHVPRFGLWVLAGLLTALSPGWSAHTAGRYRMPVVAGLLTVALGLVSSGVSVPEPAVLAGGSWILIAGLVLPRSVDVATSSVRQELPVVFVAAGCALLVMPLSMLLSGGMLLFVLGTAGWRAIGHDTISAQGSLACVLASDAVLRLLVQ